MNTLVGWRSMRYPDLTMTIRPGSSDEKACREVIDDNAYQRPRLGFTIDPGDRWLDGGANIGAFAALALWQGAEVVAVEPVPAHVELCLVNAPGATVLPGVVMAEAGWAEVHVRPDELAWRSSILPQADAIEVVRTPAYPLAGLVAGFDLDCVKLDIEGAELDLLEAWTPSDQIRKLAFEWSFDVDPSIPRLRAVLRRLEALDFRVSSHTYVTRGRGIAAPVDTWTFYPPGLLNFAWR